MIPIERTFLFFIHRILLQLVSWIFALVVVNFLLLKACMHLACAALSKDYKQWFAELNCDLDKILEISQQIFKLYDLWKNFDEKKEVPSLLQKMPKPKPAPSSR